MITPESDRAIKPGRVNQRMYAHTGSVNVQLQWGITTFENMAFLGEPASLVVVDSDCQWITVCTSNESPFIRPIG